MGKIRGGPGGARRWKGPSNLRRELRVLAIRRKLASESGVLGAFRADNGYFLYEPVVSFDQRSLVSRVEGALWESVCEVGFSLGKVFIYTPKLERPVRDHLVLVLVTGSVPQREQDWVVAAFARDLRKWIESGGR